MSGLDELRHAVDAAEADLRAAQAVADERYQAWEWVERNGGLEAVKRRIMPEGHEWPRDAKGVPIVRGETVWANGGGKGDGRAWHVRRVSPGNGYPVDAEDGKGERRDLKPGWLTHERPAPKVLDADGVEIGIGDKLYDTGTGCARIVRAVNDNGTVEFDGHENRGWFGKFLTHRAPVLAADDKPLREGETVYDVEDAKCYPHIVASTELDGLGHVKTTCEEPTPASVSIHPSRLTHERPDTWERIEDDAKNVADLWASADINDSMTMGKLVADIVRRCKALAGVSE